MKPSANAPKVTFVDTEIAGNTPREVEFVTLGNKTFAYASSEFSDSVHIFRVGNDAGLTPVTSLSDSTNVTLDQASGLTSGTIGDTTYLFVAGTIDDGITSFKIRADGTLLAKDTLTDEGILRLNAPNDGLEFFSIGQKNFLVSTSSLENGLQMMQVKGNGNLEPTDQIASADNFEYRLGGVQEVVHVPVGNANYIVAGTSFGLTMFEVNKSGEFEFVTTVDDTAGLPIQSTRALATAEVGGRSYVFAAGTNDGIGVFEVSKRGDIINVSNILDPARDILDETEDLSAFEVDGNTYLAAVDGVTDIVSLYKVSKNGILTQVELLLDDSEIGLERGEGVDAITLPNGTTVLAVVGEGFQGQISTYEFDIGESGGGGNVINGSKKKDTLKGTKKDDAINAKAGNDTVKGQDGDDSIEGGSGKDKIQGGSGNDTIDGGTGNDRMSGDAGKDTFLFNKKFGNDIITDFDAAGNDEIVLAKGQGEAITGNQFLNALSQDGDDVVYDFNNDGKNTITFLNTDLSDFGKDDISFA